MNGPDFERVPGTPVSPISISPQPFCHIELPCYEGPDGRGPGIVSITEEAFDPALNPIRAKVSLSLRVLTVDDLGFDSKGGGLFMTYLQTKEQLAQPRASLSFTPLGITGIP